MQFSKLAFVAALAAVASAQTCSISDLPTCAVTPALQAIGSTGCSATDLACVCKNQAFIASLTPAIKAGCSAADYQKAVTTAACLCAQAGVTLNIPSSSASAAPATSASVAPVSSSASVAATTVSTTVAAVTTGASVTSPPKNATVTTSGPAVVTANAAAGHGSFVAAGLLGVGALLAAL